MFILFVRVFFGAEIRFKMWSSYMYIYMYVEREREKEDILCKFLADSDPSRALSLWAGNVNRKKAAL